MSTAATRVMRRGCGISSPASAASRLSTARSAMRERVRTVARADVRHDQQVRRGQQRVVGRQRLGVGDVEPGAGDLARLTSASRSATWSTVAAARGVDQVRGRLHPRELRRRPSGAGSRASAACAARRSRPARAARRAGCRTSASCGRSSSRSPRRGAPSPGRSGPSRRSRASGRRGRRRACALGCHGAQRPSRTSRSPSLIRRAMPSSSANAMSAVASVSTPGVLPTGMPRSFGRVEVDVVGADGEVGDGLDATARRRSSSPSTFSVTVVSSASACCGALEQRVAAAAACAPPRRRPRARPAAGPAPGTGRSRRDENLATAAHHGG